AAVETVLATEEKEIVIVTQRDASIEEPAQEDLFGIGTRAVIKKMVRQEDYLELIVHGVERVVVTRVIKHDNKYLLARVRAAAVPLDKGTEAEALRREVLDLAKKMHELARPGVQLDVADLLADPDDPVRLAYTLGSMISLELEKEQALLDASAALDAL